MADTPKLESVFETNANKDFLRLSYDGALIKTWRIAQGKPLKYFGLPAWQMLDVIAWQDHLGRFTTIERKENEQHLLFLKANIKNIENRLHSLYGEFDQILINGRDDYGNGPEWPYDLFNLDYFGGFLYSNMARPKAIRKLISNQGVYERSFVLIITQQLRDRDVVGEKLSFLKDLQKSLKSGILDAGLHPEIDKVIEWYESATIPDAARQALYINFFLRDAGETEHFDVLCRPAIIYPGTGGAWMIHFVTDFHFRSGIGHRAASDQTLVELINLGLLEVQDGGFAKPRYIQPKLSVQGQGNGR
jgi:hypothetical protein